MYHIGRFDRVALVRQAAILPAGREFVGPTLSGLALDPDMSPVKQWRIIWRSVLPAFRGVTPGLGCTIGTAIPSAASAGWIAEARIGEHSVQCLGQRDQPLAPTGDIRGFCEPAGQGSESCGLLVTLGRFPSSYGLGC